jgi:hypothetical protein
MHFPASLLVHAGMGLIQGRPDARTGAWDWPRGSQSTRRCRLLLAASPPSSLTRCWGGRQTSPTCSTASCQVAPRRLCSQQHSLVRLLLSVGVGWPIGQLDGAPRVSFGRVDPCLSTKQGHLERGCIDTVNAIYPSCRAGRNHIPVCGRGVVRSGRHRHSFGSGEMGACLHSSSAAMLWPFACWEWSILLF